MSVKQRGAALLALLTAVPLIAAVASDTTTAGPEPVAGSPEQAVTFTANDGTSVSAFRGYLEVAENRANPGSRSITLGYLRFPATGQDPGNPIVYLAGGPGGSGTGTARGPRFPLFMAMREHGDVIAFDQRGTGLSNNDLPACSAGDIDSDGSLASDEEVAQRYRAAAQHCRVFWQQAGIDLAGYTSTESVRDLSALRRHLAADRLNLWGISYGSHLALAAIKEIPREIDRVVLASVEGLAQTVKLPARTDAYFARLQAAVNSQPAAAAHYPDIAAMMRRVQSKLESNPLQLDIPAAEGSSARLLFQRRHAQQLASMAIADPQYAAILLAVFADLDSGGTTLLKATLQQLGWPRKSVELHAMPTAMDVASGIGRERLAEFDRQAPRGIVGAYLNFPMPQLDGIWPDIDLGPGFRQPPTGDTPVLVLSGTLDGRTYIDGQAEAVAGLSRAHIVTVHNAGHNLFMSSGEVQELIHAFMRGQENIPDAVNVPLPDLTAVPFPR
jgi:pimeloyl-ACP methyl ester carboxylesterase